MSQKLHLLSSRNTDSRDRIYMTSVAVVFEFEMSLIGSPVWKLDSQLLVPFQMVIELLGGGSLWEKLFQQGQALRFCSCTQFPILSLFLCVDEMWLVSLTFLHVFPHHYGLYPLWNVNQNEMIIPEVAFFQDILPQQEIRNWSRGQDKFYSLNPWKCLENKWVGKLSRFCQIDRLLSWNSL